MSSPRGRRLTLVAGVTGAVVVALDGTVLTVARPRLQRDRWPVGCGRCHSR